MHERSLARHAAKQVPGCSHTAGHAEGGRGAHHPEAAAPCQLGSMTGVAPSVVQQLIQAALLAIFCRRSNSTDESNDCSQTAPRQHPLIAGARQQSAARQRAARAQAARQPKVGWTGIQEAALAIGFGGLPVRRQGGRWHSPMSETRQGWRMRNMTPASCRLISPVVAVMLNAGLGSGKSCRSTV